MGWLQEEVLRRADIVEVVSEYIPLKKKGANYWALSPFKPEKTPSFAVSPSKQIFKCFASGKGGNVIRFLMEMEGISYGEALRKLARKYGIDLPESGEEQTLIAREKQRYLAVYQAATAFYQAQLSGSPAEAYLLRRGLTPATTTAFGLGYAPPDGSALTQYLLRLGYSEELLLTAGLSARSETTGKLYDRFRDRVIFPIQDEQGAVIAFAGRSLGPGEPKYLNSPDTPFYQKSEILYGLFQARSTLRRGTPPLIVEGYMDVISLHQGGFPQAVATCGTALTEAHLQKLRRYAREVILLYDNDEAGHAATERAITMALSANFFVSVASLSEAKDPDELLQTSGPTAMEKVLAARQSWVAYLSNKLPDAPSPQARYELLEKLGQALQAITDPLLQRSYIEEIKEKLDIPPDFWQGYLYAERFARQPHPFNRQRITAEKELLRMILTYPTLSYGGIPLWQLLQEEFRHLTFSEPEGEAVRQAICEASPTEPPTLSVLTERLSPEVQDWLTALLMERYTLSSHWRTWDDSPLEEDPLIIVETNLNLLHLQHLQRLLEENLSILQRLSPDDPTYAEHLSLHQVLLRQRATLAHQQGVILPYRTLPPSSHAVERYTYICFVKADSAAPIRVRLLGWLVLAAYGVTYLFLYFYHSSLSAEARSFYWQLYGICLVPLGISVYGTYQSHWIGWRLGIVLMAILPLFLEVAVFIPPNAGILWFGIFVVGIANVAVFRRKELRYGMALLGVVTLLAIGIALFHSYTAYLPANVMSHGTMRFGLLSSSIGAATLLAVLRYGEIQKQLHLKEEALMTALAEQQALTAMAEERQREAELRRQEAEAALAEIARLREAESARLRQEAFLSRYEQLMRESYTEPLPAFLRKLLESLSDEVSVLGGVFYLRTEGGWRAAAAYAFPDLVGKEVQNGILHIAASLRVPHFVAPAPAGTPSPKSALIRHKPHAVWYIPFYSESTHETLGVAELLLAKLPSSEETQWVQGLLGRIGTYLWVRLRESSESTPDAQIPSQITTS